MVSDELRDDRSVRWRTTTDSGRLFAQAELSIPPGWGLLIDLSGRRSRGGGVRRAGAVAACSGDVR